MKMYIAAGLEMLGVSVGRTEPCNLHLEVWLVESPGIQISGTLPGNISFHCYQVTRSCVSHKDVSIKDQEKVLLCKHFGKNELFLLVHPG